MIRQQSLLRFCRARDLLREVKGMQPSIAEVARETATSRYHFIRQFQALFGETPHQYRIRARLEEAKRLLALSNGTVTEICLAVGFTSIGSFSDLFARRFGEAPSAYRRRVGSTTGNAVNHNMTPANWCTTLMCDAWVVESQFSRSGRDQEVPDSSAFNEKVGGQ